MITEKQQKTVACLNRAEVGDILTVIVSGLSYLVPIVKIDSHTSKDSMPLKHLIYVGGIKGNDTFPIILRYGDLAINIKKK